MSDRPAQPLVTANQVTFARLASMPVMVWLFYQGRAGQWAALALGSVIATTDLLDGYLARRYGPTVLGGLMDPIADKVFIAVIIVPPVQLGWFPAWPMALVFVRELLVTALRTAYERRGISLATSYLAKVKTWVQMQGLATMLLYILVDDRALIWGALLVGTGGSLAALGLRWLVARVFWRGALIMFACFVLLDALYVPRELAVTLELMSWGLVVVTWASGVDYFVSGLRALPSRGGLDRADAVRVLSAVVLPLVVVAALVVAKAPMWAAVSVLAVELAIFGLDNLLAHHGAHAGAIAWSARSLGASALLAAPLAARAAGADLDATPATLAALVVSITGGAREFWRGRRYYM